jgi:hypothetical protein
VFGLICVRYAVLIFISEVHTGPHKPALFSYGEELSCLELQESVLTEEKKRKTRARRTRPKGRSTGEVSNLARDSHHWQAIRSVTLGDWLNRCHKVHGFLVVSRSGEQMLSDSERR